MARVSTRALSDGIGSLAQAIIGGQNTFGQAAEQGAIGQSKIAQAIASIKASDASARLHGAQADDVQAGLEMQKPENVRRNAMTANGIPLDEEDAVTSFIQSGNLGGKYKAPADGVGPFLPEPEWKGKLGGISRAISNTQTALTLGDKNSENVAKANQMGVNADLEEQIRAGKLNPITVALSKMAMKGDNPYDFKEFGVGNNYTGTVDDSTGPAKRFGDLRVAETGKNVQQAGAAKANAAESYAGVKLKNAQTAKANQDVELGSKGTIQQTDQGMMLVDTRSGTARPVMGVDGKPLQGKAGNLTEGERKAATLLTRLRGSQDQLLDVLGQTPGAAKPSSAAEFVRSIPVIGGNTPANMITPEARQRVESAQLDILDAALTLGTGAAYTKEQLVGYAKSYFPQIGDGPKTIADKKVRLANVIRAAEIAAGKAEPLAPKAKSGGASGEWGGQNPTTPSGATVSNW